MPEPIAAPAENTPPAIRLSGVSKLYKVFANRRERMLDALGIARVLPKGWVKPRMFWSLREVDLEIPTGSRIGIIGRNGAGKSTLLKMINGTIAPSEGTIDVRGKVQALFETGAGFHPEFTGYENIRAALTYQGLGHDAIEEAVQEIAVFTELEDFLAQPFKTYSMGMQARLTFATATAVNPDVLIVDEVLGAGDAYFLTKSAERMRRLVERTHATVLIVSHALDQVLRYCEECVWLERGRVARRGPALEVINAYEAFIHDLEDKRLRGKNRLPRSDGEEVKDAFDRISLRVDWEGAPETGCSISEIKLTRDGQTVEALGVGDVQDADLTHFASLILAGSDWSEPLRAERGFCRDLVSVSEGGVARGQALFRAPGMIEEGAYDLEIRCRRNGAGKLVAVVLYNGEPIVAKAEAPQVQGAWADWKIPLGRLPKDAERRTKAPDAGTLDPSTRRLYRWPSDGSVRFSHIELTDQSGRARAVFEVGSTMRLSFELRAEREGNYALVAGVSLYRVDGVFISNLISPEIPAVLAAGETRRLEVVLSPVTLGNGHYVLSLSLFEKKVTQETRYDLVARCVEFSIVGNDPLQAAAVFQHPATWSWT